MNRQKQKNGFDLPSYIKEWARLFCFFIIIFWSHNSYGTILIPDYIKKDTVTDANARTITRMLVDYDTVRQYNVDSGLAILKAALAQSEKTKFTWGRATALSRLGSEHMYKGMYPQALQYFFTYLKEVENDPEYLQNANVVYNHVGSCYDNLGQHSQALGYFYKALAVMSRVKITNATDSCGIYINIGILWGRLGDMNYALQYLKLAEKYAKKDHRYYNTMSSLYINMGTCYKLLDDMPKAEQCYRQALQYANKKTRVKHISSCYDALSTLAHRKGNYTMALALLDSARRAEVTTAFYNVAFKHANRMIAEGSIHLDMKNYDKAKLLLEKGHSDATKMQNNELLIEAKPSLAEVYAATGEQEKAYRLMQEYTEMKDTLLKQEQARSVKVQTDVILGEKDRTMLAQKLEITSQKHTLQQKNFMISGTLLGSLLLSLLSFALIRIYKNKQAAQQSLILQLQQTQEINQLKAQVRGEEQERQRIAHELHDNISGQLWALKLNVDNMKQTGPQHEGYQRNLATIYKQLTEASQDVRKTAHNLLPDLLLQEGLATALASLCEKTSKNTRLEIDFQEYGTVPRMDREIELSIYRMVQELIQNVMKHAYEATHILVQLSCVNNLLSITVEDNGKGFNENNKHDGVGLQQIRKRSITLKGTFDVQSIPGKGTTAYLEFDLQHFL